MPDYLVTMGERMAAFVKRWLADEVKPVPIVVAEIEQNRDALRDALERFRKSGAL